MKTVLILGDCQSNGNNCLSDQILLDQEPRTFSLRYHQKTQEAINWAVQQKDFKSSNDKWSDDVWKYLRQKEMLCSWTSYLNANVVNLSFNGAHFFGHCRRLKNYIDLHGIPDLVIVTDYEFSHVSYSVKHNNKKYYFESLTTKNQDPDVENLRIQAVDRLYKRSGSWHSNFHRRSFNLLIKILNFHSINYKIVRFGQCTKKYEQVFSDFMLDYIDCLDLRKKYTVDDPNSDFGAELGTVKLEHQSIIAQRIKSNLDL
jgi:hypothetical protein